MKTLPCAILLIASTALVVPGCSKNSSLPLTPGVEGIGAPTPPEALSKTGPIIHAVEGSTNGLYFGVYPKNIVNTFSAHQYADGSFDGQYTINCQNALNDKTLKWNARVIFLKIHSNLEGYGKFAVIGGVETTGPYAGTYELLFVIDNGPGANPQTAHSLWVGSDAASVVEKGNTAPADLISELGIETSDRGNLRVY